ncbi:MAG: SIS domain-containing protein [Thermoproteota archaeon]|jgi:D-arabinose 5-phosphate isomerase GutQ|nr:SIS domain-containing protein [Thermoproteota archaeon]
MLKEIAELRYLNAIKKNLEELDEENLRNFYYNIISARVIVPTGEGRSKGALSIACSEIAKMERGRIILDRSDIGFPGRDLYEAAPVIRRKYGPFCLLVNSGSGKALIPLIDAQKLAQYIVDTGNNKDYRINVLTSDPESPLAKLGYKFGTTLLLKGKRETEISEEGVREFREHGILGDIFELGSAALFQAIAEAMNNDAPSDHLKEYINSLLMDLFKVFDNVEAIKFLNLVADELEKRNACFFGGLGSGLEVARMAAVRIGHIKRILGDATYVVRDTNLPSPRTGDVFIVISYSGETEIVVGWCRNFKRLGGKIISITGNANTSIGAISDINYVLETSYKKGEPNRFYLKAAFLLSPLPIFMVSRMEQRGFSIPEYVFKWYQSVISII